MVSLVGETLSGRRLRVGQPHPSVYKEREKWVWSERVCVLETDRTGYRVRGHERERGERDTACME